MALYDTIDKGLLQEILRKRVRDGVLLRLIGKWLNAGVMEEGVVYHPETGTPPGVVSSIHANVFLHEVLDTWFERDIKPRLRGKGFLVRFADDGVFVFETERDARSVLAVLSKRLEKYRLKLHPEKTRLLPFHRPKHSASGKAGDLMKPASFNFLGFTHYWGRSLKGYWVVRRKTEKSRFSRARKAIADWCKANQGTDSESLAGRFSIPTTPSPPKKNAQLRVATPTTRERNRNIRSRARLGKRQWHIKSGYSRRSLVENTMSRYQSIIGPTIRSRTLQGQRVESRVGCRILNRMTALGMPQSHRVD